MMFKLLFKQKYRYFLLSSAFYCNRVRFAPSPTGNMHVGGLKTALINYIFAKSTKGKLIFRLEDTDQARYDNKSADNILRSINFLGLKFDEGIENGKLNNEYIQSNRLIHYQNAVQKLLKDGKAYHCFCSSQRLDFLRKEQNRRQENPGYDQKCLKLTSKEIALKVQQGLDHVVRLKVENCDFINFNDAVFGPVTVPGSSVDRDPIIIKTDGFPVYHLANVVDDHLMNISHVIRGQEWLVSTPKHLVLYNSFGWQPPHFAHLPLIMKADGSKVSKRDADFLQSYHSVDNLIDCGFSPDTVISWLMSSGGGLTSEWHPSMSLSDFIDKFSLSRISTHSAGLNESLLLTSGRSYMMSLNLTPTYFDDVIASFLLKHSIKMSFEQFEHYFQRLKHRMTCLKDFTKFSYLWNFHPPKINELTSLIDGKSITISKVEATKSLLERFLFVIQSKEDNVSSIDNIYEGICSKGSAMKCLRKSLINQLEGPRISELIHILTKDEVIHRLNSILLKTFL